ncbi:MAG: tyrosine-type recombinase/integrase [Clostridiales bacterium]|nr:tyrosine-type recombinase/integrase [Clostridiales bacterium]
MMRKTKDRIINEKVLADYRRTLVEEEKSSNTIDQYLRDLEAFMQFADGKPVDKDMARRYKESMEGQYQPRSINAKLCALNGFFKRMGWYDCLVKLKKIQKETFRLVDKVMTKEEYEMLLAAARRLGRKRLNLVMQTLCSMGLRVSELRFITVEAVRRGFADVTLKGKTRRVLLPKNLRLLLGECIKDAGIKVGSVFVTRNGKPLDRSNICRDMKALAEEAGIARSKIFPHNLRHLFACVFYAKEKNANHLADIMGHSSLNTTRIYTQGSMEEQMTALNNMGLVDLSDFLRERKKIMPTKEKTA